MLKTWEVLKALTENPKLKFKRNDGLILKTNSKIHGSLVVDHYFDYSHPEFVSYEKPLLNDGWELVREPVDFMTAIRAFDEGKKISCKTHDFGTRYYVQQSQLCKHLKDNTDTTITSQEILNGKWFVEG